LGGRGIQPQVIKRRSDRRASAWDLGGRREVRRRELKAQNAGGDLGHSILREAPFHTLGNNSGAATVFLVGESIKKEKKKENTGPGTLREKGGELKLDRRVLKEGSGERRRSGGEIVPSMMRKSSGVVLSEPKGGGGRRRGTSERRERGERKDWKEKKL